MENIAFLIPTCLVVGFVLVGIWLLFTSVQQFMLKRKHLPHMERVEGTVIDVERKKTGTTTQRGKTTDTYSNFPVIQFTRSSGEVITFTSEAGDFSRRRRGTPVLQSDGSIAFGKVKTTLQSQYQKGDTLPVLYDPDGALKPMIDGGANIWQMEIFMALGGAVFLAAAIVIIVLFGGRIIAALPFAG